MRKRKLQRPPDPSYDYGSSTERSDYCVPGEGIVEEGDVSRELEHGVVDEGEVKEQRREVVTNT
jgi:hypothetical protein